MSEALLRVRNLSVTMPGDNGTRTFVSGLDMDLAAGGSLALVGESGSGKSLTARALLGLLPEGLHSHGQIEITGRTVESDTAELRALRGTTISLLMQDPFTMLNPLRRVGAQIADSFPRSPDRAAEVARRLDEVGLSADVSRRYPYQLSGGMRQRVGIAAALAGDPAILIADEPTTALDVTTQRDVLRLVRDIQHDRGMGFVLITHDLRVAFSMCDAVHVLYAGQTMEGGDASSVQRAPHHPYTAALLSAEPPVDRRLRVVPSVPGNVPAHDAVAERCAFADRCQFATDACTVKRPPLTETAPGRQSACIRIDEVHDALTAAPDESPAPVSTTRPGTALLHVEDLTKTFHGAHVPALDGVSLRIHPGESVGLVGESGSGKTTLARCVTGLEEPTSGRLRLGDDDISSWRTLSRRDTARLRRSVQMVFQDPYSSLNPMRPIGATLAEVLRAMRQPATRTDVAELLERVGLPAAYAPKRPASLSGGERQRVAIARAIAGRPALLVCDESVSALDVSVQAQILRLLDRLRSDLGMAMLFVTHDLAVVRQVTDTVYVLRHGECVESGATDTVLDEPSAEYTRRLLASVPRESSAWLAD